MYSCSPNRCAVCLLLLVLPILLVITNCTTNNCANTRSKNSASGVTTNCLAKCTTNLCTHRCTFFSFAASNTRSGCDCCDCHSNKCFVHDEPPVINVSSVYLYYLIQRTNEYVCFAYICIIVRIIWFATVKIAPSKENWNGSSRISPNVRVRTCHIWQYCRNRPSLGVHKLSISSMPYFLNFHSKVMHFF